MTDVKAAVDAIGKTPVLDFKLADDSTGTTTYTDTGLTGEYLKSAELQFGSTGNSAFANTPTVVLHFNDDGAKLFEQITSANVGHVLAIFLDGQPISTPVIQEAIPDGNATITGQFTPEQARDLVQNLNFGALPVPITLESSDTVEPRSAQVHSTQDLSRAPSGSSWVALFRSSGTACGSHRSHRTRDLHAPQHLYHQGAPVTLTASGIAGFILSIGLAVDANVLIFERIKEELRRGVPTREAARIGFHRAWPAIRDGHLTMIISSVILFWIGTSLVKDLRSCSALVLSPRSSPPPPCRAASCSPFFRKTVRASGARL